MSMKCTFKNVEKFESFQTNIVEQAGGKLWNFNKTGSVDFKKNVSILTAEDKTEARFSRFC
ncbi:hypothetical protein FACS189449_03890 [Alphaproteobacteria bacterium]|nr:hypothetical protein FACS189449_03890 [Alphaproteobacteria bacterium]